MLPRFRIILEYVDNWVRFSVEGFLLTLPLTILFRILDRTLYNPQSYTIHRPSQFGSSTSSTTSATSSTGSSSRSSPASSCSSQETSDCRMGRADSPPPPLESPLPRRQSLPQRLSTTPTPGTPGASGIPSSWGSPRLVPPAEWGKPPPTGAGTPQRWSTTPRQTAPQPRWARFTPRYPRTFYHPPAIPHPSRCRAPIPRPATQGPQQSTGCRPGTPSQPVAILQDFHQ